MKYQLLFTSLLVSTILCNDAIAGDPIATNGATPKPVEADSTTPINIKKRLDEWMNPITGDDMATAINAASAADCLSYVSEQTTKKQKLAATQTADATKALKTTKELLFGADGKKTPIYGDIETDTTKTVTADTIKSSNLSTIADVGQSISALEALIGALDVEVVKKEISSNATIKAATKKRRIKQLEGMKPALTAAKAQAESALNTLTTLRATLEELNAWQDIKHEKKNALATYRSKRIALRAPLVAAQDCASTSVLCVDEGNTPIDGDVLPPR